MNTEVDEQVELEKYRTINAGLAAHPATSTEFLQKLMGSEQEEIVVREEPEEQWHTPETREHLTRLIQEGRV